MSDSSRQALGSETYRVVYGDMAKNQTPRGENLWIDSMVDQLFAEVWARPGLAVRDRRLLVIGALAAQGQGHLVGVQVRRAVEAGELTLDEAEEAMLQLTHYVGWGLGTHLAMVVPRLRAELDGDGA